MSASDASTASTCSGTLTTFGLSGIGRETTVGAGTGNIPATWAASTYPSAGGNILFNGTPFDGIYFGPSGPTNGASAI